MCNCEQKIFLFPQICEEPKSLQKYLSVPPPSTVLVATATTPVLMSVATPVVMVTVAASIILVVIVIPCLTVLLMTARPRLIPVTRVSAAAVHLGRMMPLGCVMLPWATSAWISTCRRLSLLRLGEGVSQLLKLLHVKLPHHVVHLQTKERHANRLYMLSGQFPFGSLCQIMLIFASEENKT